MDWFHLLAVHGTLKSLLQHHNSKASIPRCSAFFIVQLSHRYVTTGKTIALTRQTFVGKVMSLLFNMLSSLVMEKAMATHSSTLAWKIPQMEEPGRLQSMGSQRVGHDWATSLFTFMHWRRKWQPTPVFLPGKSHGRRSLVGYCPWGRRVRHDWETSLFTFMHWRRKWQPTPVLLPGESQGWGSLVGCRLWGRIESDTTEVT